MSSKLREIQSKGTAKENYQSFGQRDPMKGKPPPELRQYLETNLQRKGGREVIRIRTPQIEQ